MGSCSSIPRSHIHSCYFMDQRLQRDDLYQHKWKKLLVLLIVLHKWSKHTDMVTRNRGKKRTNCERRKMSNVIRWKIRAIGYFQMTRNHMGPIQCCPVMQRKRPQSHGLINLRKQVGDVTLASSVEAGRIQRLIEQELDSKMSFELHAGDSVLGQFERLKRFQPCNRKIPDARQRLRRLRASGRRMRHSATDRINKRKSDQDMIDSDTSSEESLSDESEEELCEDVIRVKQVSECSFVAPIIVVSKDC